MPRILRPHHSIRAKARPPGPEANPNLPKPTRKPNISAISANLTPEPSIPTTNHRNQLRLKTPRFRASRKRQFRKATARVPRNNLLPRQLSLSPLNSPLHQDLLPKGTNGHSQTAADLFHESQQATTIDELRPLSRIRNQEISPTEDVARISALYPTLYANIYTHSPISKLY